MDLNALEKKYQEALDSVPDTGNLRDYLLRQTLESRRDRVSRLRGSLAVENFDMVFIGKIGTGKTTAICSLFGLLGEFKRGRRPTPRTEPLLATGSGRSTICEVEIAHAEQTEIQIDPLSNDEMEALLLDFTDWVFARIDPDKYEKPTDGLPAEVERAIRNVVSLPEKEVGGKRVDTALELAREFGEGAFLEELLARSELPARIQTRATFEGGNEHEWLLETFKDLNVGKKQGFSIPKRIRVMLGPAFANEALPEVVNRVIDTKGLDEILIRGDIDHYVERENTLCLFTTSFAGAPDLEVLNYVERHLLDRTSGFERRCVLLVLPRNEEAANVLGPDGGPVEDEEAGEAIKASQALAAFQNKGLSFCRQNIVFYDSRRGFLRNRLVDEQDFADARDKFFKEIGQIVTSRRRQLESIARSLEDEIPKLLGGSQVLQPADEEIVVEAKALLGQSAVDVNTEDFVYDLMRYLRQKRRAIQFHALNRRFGVYYETNLFEIARARGHELARAATQQEIKRVTDNLSQLCERASDDVSPFLSELLEQLQFHYEAYLKAVARMVHKTFKELLQPLDETNEFWRAAIGEWGKGPGYWDRVSVDYQEGLDGLATQIHETAVNGWKSDITEPLGRFLSEG